jgi:RNA polymerase sigma factor (sigma-70 family)
MSSNAELLAAWQRGDRECGKELVKRHYDAVYRFFRSKVGDDAPDLAQKTFLGCVEGIGKFREGYDFRSWLFAIAYRQLCKHFRDRAAERARLDFGTITAFDLDPTPSSAMARSEEEQLLLAALRQIPLDMQVALELHYWERLTDADIAEVLDVPLGTIKSRIRRGRMLLRERLEQLARSPEALHNTLTNLDDWAERLGEAAGVRGPARDA